MKLSQPQYDFLASPADWVVYGGAAGSGKTHALTLDPLRHCQGPYANPLYRGAIFRRSYPQLASPGGLMDHCKGLYGPLRGDFNHTRSEFAFPCGAKISLLALQYEKDLNNYQGAQFDGVYFDEVTQFPLSFIQFLWGRCRSKSGVRPTLRMSCNPDRDTWLFDFLKWWIDLNTGLPIKERSGVMRHFLMDGSNFEWHEQPIYEGDRCLTTSATFIGATLADNTALEQSDPNYRRRLEQLDPAERERFLNGNWLVSSQKDTEWPRELFIDVTIDEHQWPTQMHNESVRMFAVDPSKGKDPKRGDYSAIVCVQQYGELKYVDADLERRSPGQIVEDLFLFCEQPHHRIRSGDLIGIESLQFQELFREMIFRYAADHQDYALSQYLLSNNTIIPIVDTLKKTMRIRRLDPHIKRREFRFLNNPGTALLLSQLRQFNGLQQQGMHDDGPDAMDACLQLPIQLRRYFEDLNKGKYDR